MSRRDTKDDLVRAALAYVDAYGIDALTLRSLGAEVGLHHTALYRHFRSKEDLLRSVLEMLLVETFDSVQPLPEDPRQRLIAISSALRAMFRAHPSLTTAVVLGAGTMSQAFTLQAVVLDALRAMGVSETDLAPVYQALETYTIGAPLYDFSGAPDHLEQRRVRFRAGADPTFDEVSRSVESIDELNERAFRWGFNAILDAAVAKPK